jgi:hypothetical protein
MAPNGEQIATRGTTMIDRNDLELRIGEHLTRA